MSTSRWSGWIVRCRATSRCPSNGSPAATSPTGPRCRSRAGACAGWGFGRKRWTRSSPRSTPTVASGATPRPTPPSSRPASTRTSSSARARSTALLHECRSDATERGVEMLGHVAWPRRGRCTPSTRRLARSPRRGGPPRPATRSAPRRRAHRSGTRRRAHLAAPAATGHGEIVVASNVPLLFQCD